ncbi:hypothetical protein [uncultured Treponema sp.]|uniref:hypothetical protein n=1 Tax=uncultured Treponema sp. TaxID=162155 RepID=UPI0025E112A6|nr:hypothetical protein [uncultured Treponema sp.]
MKKCVSCLVIALFVSCTVFAQSSEMLTKIIKSEKATCAQAAYLPALYANFINEEESLGTFSEGNASKDNAAFEAAKAKGCFSPSVTADSEITLGQICFLYAKTMNIKGGLFYSLFPSERYAFKEFKAKGILPGEADPGMKLSGRDTIDIFNTCLRLVGGNE